MSSTPSSSSSSAAPPPRIVVLGSLNMDIVLRVPHAPAAGETLLGHSIAHIPGGKGANQAVSCAREGGQVRMIGCVGNDAHGRALRESLERVGGKRRDARKVVLQPELRVRASTARHASFKEAAAPAPSSSAPASGAAPSTENRKSRTP